MLHAEQTGRARPIRITTFTIRLPHGHPHPSCSRQFTYKNLSCYNIIGNCKQMNTFTCTYIQLTNYDMYITSTLTRIGLGVVTMGSSVSSLGAVNSSVDKSLLVYVMAHAFKSNLGIIVLSSSQNCTRRS